MVQHKYIIRFSFIGLFINIIANIVLYRYFMIEEVILKQISSQNTYLAETYKSSIWENNTNAITKIKNKGYQNLLQDKDFIVFSKASANFLKNTNAEIIIYDQFGQKFFANHEIIIVDIDEYNSNSYYDKFFFYLDRYFLQNYISNFPVPEALKGKTTHSLVSRAIILDKYDKYYERSFINSYIPIINSSIGQFSVEGVLQITIDITPQWDNINFIEKRIFITFIVVFLVFFIIIMYNTNYAQRLINKQFETNRDLQEAKNRVEIESSAKTEFMANISHELRTPLNAIIGFSEIIITETHGKMENQQYKDYIVDINVSGKHLLSVINDILDFSKAASNKLNINKMELDLNKLARSSMRFVKPRADESSIQLIEDMPKNHIIIYADPKRLKQALLNLLSNSVKFTPTEGSVTLSLKKDKKKKLVYIIVADTGIGMSDQDIPKALSSFGQVDNTLSRKYDGTGLGLPLTKKLIELMDGQFDIQSVLGQGTTVTITFEYLENIEL